MTQIEPILDEVRVVLEALFEETSITKTITYKSRTDLAYSGTAGRNVETFTDHSLTAIQTQFGESSVFRSRLPFGEQKNMVIILASTAPSNMTIRDKLVIDGEVRGIKEVQPYLGVAYGLVLEGEQ